MEPGVSASGAIISSGAQVVDSSSSASATTISTGGSEIISAHGTDSGTKISGGEQDVYRLANGATIFSGSQVVDPGFGQRHDYQRRHASGGFRRQRQCHDDLHRRLEIVALAAPTAARKSRAAAGFYGTANGATIFTGSQVVETDGTASGTIVSGGTQWWIPAAAPVPRRATAGGTEIVGAQIPVRKSPAAAGRLRLGQRHHDFAGSQVVETDGTASGTIVSGGTQVDDAGGSASATTIYAGGMEVVGGTDNGAKFQAATGRLRRHPLPSIPPLPLPPPRPLPPPGPTGGATIFTGSQVVESGGTAAATRCPVAERSTSFPAAWPIRRRSSVVARRSYAGGSDPAHRYPAACSMFPGACQRRYGVQRLAGGGVRRYHGVLFSGGTQVVELGGTASGMTVSSGGTLDVLSGGGTATSSVGRWYAGHRRHALRLYREQRRHFLEVWGLSEAKPPC